MSGVYFIFVLFNTIITHHLERFCHILVFHIIYTLMGNRESVIYLLLNHITLLRSHSFKGFYDMLLSLYPQIKLILLFILYLYIIVVSLLYTTVLTMLYCIRLDYYTGVAQRKRDGLITRRSQDRNLSPVSYNSVGLQNQLVNASDDITSPQFIWGV